MSEYTVTEWGFVLPDGHVDCSGIRPGGSVGAYTESEARYIANSRKTSVVKRTKTVTTVTTEWQPA